MIKLRHASMLTLLSGQLAGVAVAQDAIEVVSRRQLTVDRIACERVPLGRGG